MLSPILIQFFYKLIRKYTPFLTLFLALSAFYFSQSRALTKEKEGLIFRRTLLTQEIESLRALKEDLYLQLRCESDIEWQELTLMRVLGVVEKGSKKILIRE